ncbi:MAG: hypothetical protein V1779_13520 [bacterium]
MKPRKKYRVIEIYFVLYLAAIIFLLPDKPIEDNSNDDNLSLLQGPFTLVPVKTSLSCRFFLDTTGVNIVSLDSINTILFTGDVDDVEFDFKIEDLSLGQKQVFTGSSKYFRFVENFSKKELVFYWSPPLNDLTTRTYLIKVNATAKDKNAKSNSPELFAETQFSLVLSNISEERQEYLPGDALSLSNQTNLYQGIPVNPYIGQPLPYMGTDATLSVSTPEVVARAYERWENKIYVFGLSSTADLAKKPEIKFFNDPVDNKGYAELGDIGKNDILVIGKTPSHGKMKVKVIAKFKSNNSTKEIDFNVTPVTIEKPSFESVMYPGKNYHIDSKLPFLGGQRTSAYIKDKGNVILKIEQGEPVEYKPDITQVGKVLTLERYIDDKFYDSYDIRINDYQDPIVYNIEQLSKEEVKVITRCYGFYNGEQNYVRLELKGNAVVSLQPRGKIPKGDDDITVIQIFKIAPKSKDKPFNFDVKAIDLRGKESPWKSFTQYE